MRLVFESAATIVVIEMLIFIVVAITYFTGAKASTITIV
jgi:hypothetical protein